MKLLQFLLFSIYFFTLCDYISSDDTPLDEIEWQSYMKKYGKTYTSQFARDAHKKKYTETKNMVEEHNKRYDNGLESYRMGLNNFADMLPSEFRARLTTRSASNQKDRQTSLLKQSYSREQSTRISVPESIDWRKLGAVTDVKDQKKCGSCWAFATTGVIEGQLFKKTGQLISLSEQNLVDCSRSNEGCCGGYVYKAYNDINSTIGGLVPSKLYPYEGKRDDCRFQPDQSVVKVLRYTEIEFGNEIELKEAVANIGPIAVAFQVVKDPSKFKQYETGIYSDTLCTNSKSELNHEMLLVGYGVQNGKDYWIVKNSWGENWGENGYARIKSGGNTCGIASDATFPIIVPVSASEPTSHDEL
ncbi:hypothetical protein B566_EDAN008510 [Ephemera danica]|nr:hypothetical protein B566_EDAN008510 [Ephemera danica]